MSKDEQKVSGWILVMSLCLIIVYLWLGQNCYQNPDIPQGFKNLLLAVFGGLIIVTTIRLYIDFKKYDNQ